MKKFVTYIASVFFVMLTIAYILNYYYTQNYANNSPCNKTQWIHQTKNIHVDYLFLGSSRVENTVIPKIIETKTGKKALNLGMQGAQLKDLVFIIDWLKSKNITAERYFIQLDYNWNNEEGFSTIMNAELLPLESEDPLISRYIAQTNSKLEYNLIKYVPLYSYTKVSSKVGLRYLFLSSIGVKPMVINNTNGYVPVIGKSDVKKALPATINSSNHYFQKLLTKVPKSTTFFCAPVHPKLENRHIFYDLKKKNPSLYDFHNSITNENYFHDATHLNHDGAVKFTSILIHELDL